MLNSMTGYGKASVTLSNKTISVEIKSLNSKYLDINIRLPQIFKEKEMTLRQFLAKQAHRGKVDVYILVDDLGQSPHYAINVQTIRAYYEQLAILCTELNIPKDNLVNAIMGIPDVTKVDRKTMSKEDWDNLQGVFNKALDAFKQFRKTEGSVLAKDFEKRIKNILAHLKIIQTLTPLRLQKVRTRIEDALNALIDKNKIDLNRFEQEMLYYLEKFDINEEVVRLDNHCQYFLKELALNEGVKGKKLSFIAQEIGREINTIGAKANYAEIQTLVVKMKDELEKIREQVMNVL